MESQTADEDLLERFIAGDETAFEQLLGRYQHKVFQFVLWYTERDRAWAEDVSQEIWVQAFRSARRFQGRSSFKTWLYALARLAEETGVAPGWDSGRAGVDETESFPCSGARSEASALMPSYSPRSRSTMLAA